MMKFKKKTIFQQKKAQGLLEYGLLVAFIAVIAFVGINALGINVSNAFTNTNNQLPAESTLKNIVGSTPGDGSGSTQGDITGDAQGYIAGDIPGGGDIMETGGAAGERVNIIGDGPAGGGISTIGDGSTAGSGGDITEPIEDNSPSPACLTGLLSGPVDCPFGP
jgi:Flp pilus assembly pilin Flp